MQEQRHYTVIYRTGGTRSCTWRRLFARYTYTEACRQADAIERQGYHTRVEIARELDAIGLPVGWQPGYVDWDRDHIEYEPHRTYWEAR